MRAVYVSGLIALACASACGDDTAPPPGSVVGTARSSDADAGDGGMRNGRNGNAGAGGMRDGGRPFGFGEFGVDASGPAPRAGAGGSGGSGMTPPGWHCAAPFGADDVCDCGCGALDPACAGEGCSEPGCARPACQVCYSATGEARDCGAPGAWRCEAARQGDGVCDCGCGALDPDCEALRGCYPLGCNVDGCEVCQSARGSAACETPAEFTCDESALENGKCDCGCGNLDPECAASACEEPGCAAIGCDVCHDAEGAAQACESSAPACDAAVFADSVCDCGCGEVDPACDDEGCVEPGCRTDACETCHDAFGRASACVPFRCDPARAGDGVCDCGCGAPDPDCPGEGCTEPGCEDDACAVRHDENGDPIVSDDFECKADAFEDARCDCGCGAPDPACGGGGCSEPGCRAAGCKTCQVEGDAPCDWTCEPERYGNGVCDCGCGALDPDCGTTPSCEKPGCYADGCEQCHEADGEAVACERSACPAGFQNDGVCDCGCREDDYDCAAVRDCVEPGCSARGCGRCHDAAGAVIECADFVCSFGQQGGGDGCNCGCGAPDPDCGTGAGCSAPGCRADACDTCRGTDGAPMSCMP